MKHFLCLIALTALTTTLLAVPKYPFPQNVKYPFGIKPANIDNAKVQKAFEDFMKLYKESDDKTMARIQHDTPENTVSEGIGYGMMILVYMDNATNNTQEKFDKLWNYYKKFSGSIGGLMSWRIKGFEGPANPMLDKNAATDADLDAAVGLMEAYKQWDDKKYLTAAESLIVKISKSEVNANGYLKPGDSWDNEKNPSYFSTAALQLFKQVSSFDWDKVISNSYALTKKAQNETTGLIPNWCSEEGVASPPTTYDQNRGNYYYDATRTPWRFAWAYSWYGHQDAKDICTKIASWISTKTGGDPTKILNGYKLDGTGIVDYCNSTFVGPFGCAGMVDAVHQTWVDKCYEYLPTIPETVYYQISMKIMTMLLLSGNMPDLWTTTAVEPNKKIDKKNTSLISLSINSATAPQISFFTAISGHVTIAIHTPTGRLVATPVNGIFTAGSHKVTPATKLPAGAYIVNMHNAAGQLTKRITVIK
jgi:endoglucanase